MQKNKLKTAGEPQNSFFPKTHEAGIFFWSSVYLRKNEKGKGSVSIRCSCKDESILKKNKKQKRRKKS